MAGIPEGMSVKYRLALTSGRAGRARFVPAKVQMQRWEAGMSVSVEAVALVKRVLLGIGVPSEHVIRYIPFGMRLAHICRRHEAQTRVNLAQALVREWEGRLALRPAYVPFPDSVVLREVCRRGFGIEFEEEAEKSKGKMEQGGERSDGER